MHCINQNISKNLLLLLLLSKLTTKNEFIKYKKNHGVHRPKGPVSVCRIQEKDSQENNQAA